MASELFGANACNKIPVLDTRLRHGYVGEEVSATLTKADGYYAVLSLDRQRPISILIHLLVEHKATLLVLFLKCNIRVKVASHLRVLLLFISSSEVHDKRLILADRNHACAGESHVHKVLRADPT
jgi:hypothetical protein